MEKQVKGENKRKEKIIFVTVTAFLVILSIMFFMIGILAKNRNINDSILYSYNITRNVEYKVNLYDNNFIDKKVLDKGNTYISELTKDIEVNFKYSLSSSKKANYSYKYSIIANIDGTYQTSSSQNKNNIWSKEYTLVKETKVDEQNVSNININPSVVIDYNYYNNEVEEFKKKLKLSISAKLNVKLHIQILCNIDGDEKIVDESEVSIIIPLNERAFEIEEKYDKVSSDTILKDTYVTVNYTFIVLGISALLLDIIIFFMYFNKIFNFEKKDEYRTTVSKILKKYGDVVVEIVKPVNTKITTVIDVKNFDAMLDLEAELRAPILFHEIPKKSEGWFTLIHNDTLYRYILKDEEKKNKKNNKK